MLDVLPPEEPLTSTQTGHRKPRSSPSAASTGPGLGGRLLNGMDEVLIRAGLKKKARRMDEGQTVQENGSRS